MTGTIQAFRLAEGGLVDLKKTLLGGQCFRFNAVEGGFRGVALGENVFIYEAGDGLFVEGSATSESAARFFDYLDLGTDYEAIKREVLRLEPRLSSAAVRCGSLRILRQEPWEALCSFIISQNNNIPRIRLIVGKICERCGVPAFGGGYAFPDAERLARLSADELTALGCGYRAEYILNAARAVASGELDLELLREQPLEQARERLLALRGVGPKVADCALLFGLHRLECFPTDVWIKRALSGEFKNTPLLASPYAGVAQQYIFEHIRTE